MPGLGLIPAHPLTIRDAKLCSFARMKADIRDRTLAHFDRSNDFAFCIEYHRLVPPNGGKQSAPFPGKASPAMVRHIAPDLLRDALVQPNVFLLNQYREQLK